MIGVAATPEGQDVVREFFELFKTPWEFCRANGHYEVVLDADGTVPQRPAELVLLYGKPDQRIRLRAEALSRPTATERNALLAR